MSAILTHTANVTRDEDETLSFLVLESTDDDISVVLFERYTSEKYFKEVHFTSDSMKEYRSKVRQSSLYGTRVVVLIERRRLRISLMRELVKAIEGWLASWTRGKP